MESCEAARRGPFPPRGVSQDHRQASTTTSKIGLKIKGIESLIRSQSLMVYILFACIEKSSGGNEASGAQGKLDRKSPDCYHSSPTSGERRSQ
mmetsp:Transcript_10308/g.23561  ORF Transcript_10308/g.23561 Transcript_10308/m.23561 type:complete len:93 (-) Transcript_10308:684-962(-)